MQKLHLDFGKRSYDIVISDSFAEFPRAFSAVCGGKVLIVTDSNVAPLYLDEVRRLLYCAGFSREGTADLVIEAGEQSKNMDMLQTIYDACIRHGLDRKSTILALGGRRSRRYGGLCGGDVYARRPVRAGSDDALGADGQQCGRQGRNRLCRCEKYCRRFQAAALVYINTNTLKSLPRREISAGMAEVIKYGVIKNAAFLEYLDEKRDKVNALDAETMQTVIYNCCAVKAAVVQQDETETGLRAILNFGHTVGHGIESAKNFALLHGECVALGMLAALDIALGRGYVSEADLDKCRNLLRAYGLPEKTGGVSIKQVLEYMKNDKKKENGSLRFVLPRPVGAADVYNDVTQAELAHAVETVLE